MEYLFAALPSVIATVTLGLVAFIAKSLKTLMGEHKALMEAERNDIKAQIVAIYERAKERGYVTPMELDTANRLYDSYEDLNGNSYIGAIMHDLNTNVEIVGMPIPSIVKVMEAHERLRG